MRSYRFCLSILIITALCFSACKNDPKKEFILTHSEKELSFTNFYIIQWKDTLNENVIALDSTAEMQFAGLTGFKIIDGKAFVGASMTVKDSTGAILFHNDDLFLDYDSIGFDPLLVKERVGIFLETSHPMSKGSTYLWSTKIWDKKGNGQLHAEAFVKIR
jgi:hypothetical protein